jgi:DivIVA domain-containing protein
MAPLTPEEIEATRFPTRARGYDRHAVDAFLAEIAAELRRASGAPVQPLRQLGEEVGEFLQHAKDVAERLRVQAEQDLDAARRGAETLLERAREERRRLEDATAREAEEIKAEAEIRAQESRAAAERLRAKARSYATVVVREAKREAARVRDEAREMAERTRASAQRDVQERMERKERRVRELETLEFVLAQRVNAAEAKLQSLDVDGSESAM